MKYTIAILAFVGGALSSTSCVGLGTTASMPENQPKDYYSIRFGIVEGGGRNAKVVQETTDIPLVFCDSGARYGYTVEHAEGKRFSTYAVFYPPEPLKGIDKNLTGDPANANTQGITTETSHHDGKGTEYFCFTEGDPKGTWRIAVYINAVRSKTIEFTAK